MLGALLGARLYYVAQNEPIVYLTHPWHIVAVWEGGLAFFGGLFGAVAAAYLYARRARLRFAPLADLFAPAIPRAVELSREGRPPFEHSASISLTGYRDRIGQCSNSGIRPAEPETVCGQLRGRAYFRA
jgi:hypothetical protein